MKNLIYILFLVIGLTSCQKDENLNTNISPYQNYDYTIDESQMDVQGFKNTTWVITKVRQDGFSDYSRNDTLVFGNNGEYSYNGFTSIYYFYSTPTNFKLELYDTPWGNLVGTLYNANMTMGVTEGAIFTDMMNSSNTYKIWMYRN
jgi:hypothetical protein